MDPATPTTFRLLLEGKPNRRFEVETTLPYAAFRWLMVLLLAGVGINATLLAANAWASSPGDNRNPTATTRPDDQGDEHGQGQGAGSDQGQGPGVGRGNDPSTSATTQPPPATTQPTGTGSTTSVATIPATTTTVAGPFLTLPPPTFPPTTIVWPVTFRWPPTFTIPPGTQCTCGG